MPGPDRLVRQWKLVRLMAAGREGVSIGELARETGMTTRTIRRDLHTLRAAGFPIEGISGRHGRKTWRVVSLTAPRTGSD